jgi:hypothetical protein
VVRRGESGIHFGRISPKRRRIEAKDDVRRTGMEEGYAARRFQMIMMMIIMTLEAM